MKNMISFKFNNWAKHQPRKDYKRHHWFALSNDFHLDSKMGEFSNEEKLCLIFLLCEASRQNKHGKVEIFVDHWCRVVGVTPKTLTQAIEKIESVQIAYRICTESERYITEQNITEHKKSRGGDKHPARTSVGSSIWEAYREAYFQRYQVEPVRNATTNSQCAALAKRLGEAAVEVVRFYLSHNDGYYLRSQHPIGLCLAQAESLHTQWQRGVAVTASQVRQFENQHNTKSAVEEALEIMNRRNES